MEPKVQYSEKKLEEYPKKTQWQVRTEMDRLEKAKSKPLNDFSINGIDWKKRINNRVSRRERDAKEATILKKASQLKLAQAASHVLCYRAYLDYLVRK